MNLSVDLLDRLTRDEIGVLAHADVRGAYIDIAAVAQGAGVSFSFVESTLIHLARRGIIAVEIDIGGWIAWFTREPGPDTRERLIAHSTPPAISLGAAPWPVISQSVRWEVFEADDYTCRRCGVRRDLTVDHVVARVNGGGDDRGNLQTLCRTCNSRKGSK